MTPAQLRRQSVAARARAERLAVQARNWAERADLLARTADELEKLGLIEAPKRPLTGHEVRRLRQIQKKGTLGTHPMDKAHQGSRGAAVSAAKTRSAWPFQKALQRAFLSVPEWAGAKDLDPEVVKSWLKKPGKGGRRIPRQWADRISVEFIDPDTQTSLVPAVETSWPNGIRE